MADGASGRSQEAGIPDPSGRVSLRLAGSAARTLPLRRSISDLAQNIQSEAVLRASSRIHTGPYINVKLEPSAKNTTHNRDASGVLRAPARTSTAAALVPAMVSF